MMYWNRDLSEMEEIKNDMIDFDFNQKKANEMINNLDDRDVMGLYKICLN